VGSQASGPASPAVLFSLVTTGAAGIGLEVVLLAAFQNLYGYVYSLVAVVLARPRSTPCAQLRAPG